MKWKLQENALVKEEIESLAEFIKTADRLTQGSKVKEFEAEWSKWQGCKYSIFVNSGSSANLVLLSAVKDYYNLDNTSEVIVPAVTWVTNISPILQCGLKPVFVDINLEDLSFDYEELKKRITDKTKAIFITHLLGFPANMEKIKNAIGEKDIVILEDCCESHGAKYKNIKVGNFGLGSTFSFYWGHHMTTIEGGMISTNNEEFYKLCLLKRSHGLARELPMKYHEYYKDKYKDIDFKFLFLTDGFNVRSTEINAFLGLKQIKKLDAFIETRDNNYNMFLDVCRKYKDELITIRVKGTSSLALPFIFKEKRLKEPVEKKLNELGVETRPIISGNLLKQPFLKKYHNESEFKNANLIHDNGFYIGNNQFVDGVRLKKLESILDKLM
ncbi:CDP-4-keto-6-deoxy-D-glucose-3-dehydrase [Clostridium acetobutylicum]|nr:CDP-4-keto-6-deoxy-D-glucose-3-dehydrase [Clostridium acetobutylicum]